MTKIYATLTNDSISLRLFIRCIKYSSVLNVLSRICNFFNIYFEIQNKKKKKPTNISFRNLVSTRLNLLKNTYYNVEGLIEKYFR